MGYSVQIISGSGGSFDDCIKTVINPLFGSSHPDVLHVKAELDAGNVTPAFWELVHTLDTELKVILSNCDVCIAHNIPTLHKNLALTMALFLSNKRHETRLIAWCHDLAWTNPQYSSELYNREPWNLLRQAWQNTRYITISEPRRLEMTDLFNIPSEQITVIPPGIDPGHFLKWTPTMRRLVYDLKLLDADGLLLLPARITRRKNIVMGLRVLSELKNYTGQDFRLIVSGPPGPHNPANPGYLQELLALQNELKLEKFVHFLFANGVNNESLIIDEDTIANLFQLADGLLFPSTQEGFGIPILEAGLAGIPVFCADLPPLRQTGQTEAYYFDPVDGSPHRIAVQIAQTLLENPVSRLRTRVRKHNRWESVIREQIVPLLEETWI